MTKFPSTPSFTGANKPERWEADIVDLEVEGEIPSSINGRWYRMTPDPQFPPRLGDDFSISGDNASFIFDVSAGTITLNIGAWKNGNSRGLRFLVPDGVTRAVRINYAGNGALAFKNAVLQGTIVAPDALVTLDEGSQLRGSLRAKRVTFGDGSTFIDHHHLEPLKIDPACVSALQSSTVPVIMGR